MAITKKSDFDKVVPVNKGFTDGSSIDTFIDQAEEKFLLPLLGQAFYDDLAAIATPSAAQLKVLNPIYRAVSYTALWTYIPFGNVQISESGFQIVSTSDRKAAFEWQVKQVATATAKLGMDGFDVVLERLEADINTWPTYKTSDARKENAAYFINTAAAFDGVYSISRSRLTFLCLWPLIKEVEDQRILPRLGDYGATLKTKILDGSMDAADKKLLTAVQRTIAYLVIKDAISTMAVEISPMGLSVNFLAQSLTIDASNPASDTRLQSLLSLVTEKSKELLAELPTLLPGYVPPTNQVYNIDNGCNGIVSLF